jgi:Fe-S-cluster-containing hydrogenase component 2
MIRLENHDFVVQPSLCHQCGNPFCLKVCPHGAIEKKDDIVTIDREKCTGCKMCQKYCPYDAIVIKDKKAYKCELCGGDPQCVRVCSTGAISVCDEKRG